VVSLVDTNILIYRFDGRDPVKQHRAREVLRDGLRDDSIVLAHQCIVEFVAAAIRPREDLGRAPLLTIAEAQIEAEELVAEYSVLYPTQDVVLTALLGTAAYGLSWFDAHLWAYAEVYGVDEILSEDFTHGRHYGKVRAINPFLSADGVHDLPPLYSTMQKDEKATTSAGSATARQRRSYSARARSEYQRSKHR
jgi:predicted nucleic acid-binding protein